MRRKPDGYVDILENEGMPGVVKVGSTARSPHIRCAKINEGIGLFLGSRPFTVAWAGAFPQHAGVEAGARNLLADFYIDRELFRTSVAIARDAVLAAHEGRPPTLFVPPANAWCPRTRPVLSERSRRCRNKHVYAIMMEFHDTMAREIEACGGPVAHNPMFREYAELFSSLPGRTPGPDGVWVEWMRVCQEVAWNKETEARRAAAEARIAELARDLAGGGSSTSDCPPDGNGSETQDGEL